ncbi:MAG: hypothetical protein E3J56_13945 [Candidatus Aminicenantes bacterium]|nr:MAG: hypothetical protein E3J56_13945 [Candidatus Aminicenantes bacterium]
MTDLATRNIFHFIVRLAEQAEGDYFPTTIHNILGDLEQMAEDYLEKWRGREALEKVEKDERR